MGYTRYWQRTKKPITQDFVDEVNKIITDSRSKGITIWITKHATLTTKKQALLSVKLQESHMTIL